MKYLYIHGGNATSRSFNYIRERIGGKDMVVDYNSSNGFSTNLREIIETIKNEKDLFIVAHSLGGIYALYIADNLPKSIKGVLTLSTPYGGSSMAELFRFMLPQSKLMQDIVPSSKVMRDAASIKIRHPWWQVVTTRGSVPWLVVPNDGVVTLSSMQSREDMDFIPLDINHYEVVIDPQTVDIIKEKTETLKKFR